MESRKIFNGIKWAGIELALNALFKFGVKLYLAKLLVPEDFGLIGMTSIFIAVTTAASELGMSAALIQKKDNKYAKKLYNTSFWTGLVFGFVLFIFISTVVGPFAASFYEEPVLTKLIPVLSIGVLIRPLNLVHVVILTRSMNFKKIAVINNFSALIAGIIGIVSAHIGFGVWALVLNNFFAIALTVPFMFYATKWIPRFEWNREYFKEIFGFGIYSTGTSVFGTITYDLDNLIVGKYLGASLLGAYSLSFTLTEQLRQTISGILNKVMYPVFGKCQDDKQKLKSYFLKIVKVNAIVIYPIMGIFIFFARDLILFFFGEKWENSITVLQILSLSMMIHLSVNSFTSLLRGMGFPNIEFKIIIFLTLFVLTPSLYFGITNFGLIGVAYAILINKISLVVIALLVLNKKIELKMVQLIETLKGAIISILFSFGSILLINKAISIDFFLEIGMFIIIYIISIYLFEKKEILQLLQLIK